MGKTLVKIFFVLTALLFSANAYAITGIAAGTVGTSHKSYIPVIEGRVGFTTNDGFGFVPVTRAGNPIHLTVDNLNDSGAGSLREALESTTANRIITCNVGGAIDLSTRVNITTGNMIFLGQTCPSPGITFRNHQVKITGVSDVVIEHLRCQQGNEDSNESCFMIDAPSSNVVYSHVTSSWNDDEGIGFWSPDNETFKKNMYVLDSIMYEAINDPKNSLCDHVQVLYYRNIFAHANDRHPYASGTCQAAMVNNFLYDIAIPTQVGNIDHSNGDIILDWYSNDYWEVNGRTAMILGNDDDNSYPFNSASVYFNDNNRHDGDNPSKGDDFSDHLEDPEKDPEIKKSSTPHAELALGNIDITTLTHGGNEVWDSISATAGAFPAFRDADADRLINKIQDCVDELTCVTGLFKFKKFPSIGSRTRGSWGVPLLTVPADKFGISPTGRMNIEQMGVNCASRVNNSSGSECQ